MSDYKPERGDIVNVRALVTEVSEAGDIIRVNLSTGACDVAVGLAALTPVDRIADRRASRRRRGQVW